MIDLKNEHIRKVLEKSINDLIENNKESQLVSITKKIDNIEAISFFNKGKAVGQARAFWMSASKDFYLVGIGSALEIKADTNPFDETKRKWESLLKDAPVHNPYSVPGTGIVALGGMAFDPLKASTKLWEHFDTSQFRIPKFMLTIDKEDYYYTINWHVTRHDKVEDIIIEMTETEELLLTEYNNEQESLSIIEKQEIGVEKWKQTVKRATDEIKYSDVEKIVLAREMRLTFDQKADIGSVLHRLYETQPNSYLFAFEQGDNCFVGATPERLVKLEEKLLFSTCLAGTAPRGNSLKEDEKIASELLHDDKNREEHEFVVQMIKAAMEDYCIDLRIPAEPVIYPLRNLQHLYTPVTGKLKNGYSIFDVIEKLHPTPALGGTPKEASLAFIRENELLDRGWYGAPFGWMDNKENGEFAVAIRSALIQGDEASLFAGCGVVKDSDPESEFEETNIKFLPMLSVLGGQD
ncbi:isochorismate synthase [Oceanobacillus piezotolerans]|uniref:Isochorismate synthase MenF n=1 Tax=Oceanobacillus piezotolerans TaxID=2448030 RepID=A0A498D9R5_9BACI|nr:isochorismate synthase [Oceanobacillus piezotolerans]RLL46474.1 isochorismate synthase [Oceanobacillus piezotolerans]